MNISHLLITNGAGCLDLNLIERYFPKGYPICVIDNFSSAKREVVPIKPDLMLMDGFFADADLVNKPFVDFQPTLMVHSAAAYKDLLDWAEDTVTNVLGTIHVANAVTAHKAVGFYQLSNHLVLRAPQCSAHRGGSSDCTVTNYGISKQP